MNIVCQPVFCDWSANGWTDSLTDTLTRFITHTAALQFKLIHQIIKGFLEVHLFICEMMLINFPDLPC